VSIKGKIEKVSFQKIVGIFEARFVQSPGGGPKPLNAATPKNMRAPQTVITVKMAHRYSK
jgi:hypothetical protein